MALFYNFSQYFGASTYRNICGYMALGHFPSIESNTASLPSVNAKTLVGFLFTFGDISDSIPLLH